VTSSSGTSIHTQVRLTGGLPARFARRGGCPGDLRARPEAAQQGGGSPATALVNRPQTWRLTEER
jgi:hypothetical protein